MKAFAPYFVLRASMLCWKCKMSTAVVGVVATSVEDDGQVFGDPGLSPPEPVALHHITDLPYELLEVVRVYQPRYTKRESHTAGVSYYQNECHDCGVNIGDFYLFSEPDSPFFPTSPDAAAAVEVLQVPALGPIEVSADFAQGGIDLIFQRFRG